MPATAQDLKLADFIASCYHDPLRFVIGAYRWGEPGPLQDHKGPDAWQEAFLRDLGAQVKARNFKGGSPVAAIRMAASSGHGIGKTVNVAWLVNWIMSTRPNCQGTVTANTFTQLETKTWAAIQRWTKLCITGHWFVVTSSRMYHAAHKDSWFVAPQSSKEDNSEAFAGQHAADSTSFYIFDEASAIPESIYEVAEGGLTDGEPMIFLFGNPTRTTGKFHRVCFGSERERWHQVIVDSRDSRFTNKTQIAEWIQDYGEDSDFVRVRVRGLPPRASDLQYIGSDLVYAAQKREVIVLPDEPLVCGLDVARGGSDTCVFRFRLGLDARSIPPLRVPGEQARDSMRLVTMASDVLGRTFNGRKVAMLFVDGTGIGGPIVDRLKQLGHKNVMEIQFGSEPPNSKFLNMRSFMWGQMRDWLPRGAIDLDSRLEQDLTGPGYHHDKSDRLVLESKESMKERGVGSPDDGDALCFVAGTLVRTDQGDRPIESIRVGDLVVTPFGLSQVMVRHYSDAIALTTATFSNGASLTGKPEHQVFTFSRGKVRLDALSLTDEVEVFSQWRHFLWRVVSRCSTRASDSGFKAAVATFSPGTRLRRSDFCIAGSGLTIMGQFRQVARFITAMMTGATTPWRTLNYASAATISTPTCARSRVTLSSGHSGWSAWRRGERPLPNGTGPTRGERGTLNTASGHGSDDSRSGQCAPDAERAIRRSSQPERSTVRLPASRPWDSAGISRMLACVRGVARRSWQTVIGRRPVAPVSVRTDAVLPTRTYNLTLAEHNAYYANGVLVFNCLTFAATVRGKDGIQRPKPRGTFQGYTQRDHGWMA